MSSSSPRIAAGASIALLFLLSACAPPVAGPAGPSPSSSASPSASADAVPALAEPEPRIPGGCSDFIRTAELVALGDGRVAANHVVLSGAALADARQSGVLSCAWDSGSVAEGMRFQLALERHAQQRIDDPVAEGLTSSLDQGVPAGIDADRSAVSCQSTDDSRGSITTCSLGAVVGDYLIYSLWVTAPGTVAAGAAESTMGEVLSRVVDRLREQPVVATWAPPVGSWPIPVDCDAVDASGAVAAAVATPGLTVRDVTGLGEDGSISPEVSALGGRTECGWSATGDVPAGKVPSLYVQAVSGGGWAWETVAASDGFEAIAISGADEAGTVCRDYPYQRPECEVTARMGENIVAVREYACCGPNDITREQLIAGATAVIAGLSKRY